MPVMGANYTNETASQIQARELLATQVQNEVQVRNLLTASTNLAVATLVTTNLAACKTAGTIVEISPGLIQDIAGNITNKHK